MTKKGKKMVKEDKELVMSCWSAEGEPDNWKWFIYEKGNPRRVSHMFKIQFSKRTPGHWHITTDSTTQMGVRKELEKFLRDLFVASSVLIVCKPMYAEELVKERERIKEYVELVRAATIKVTGEVVVQQIVGTTASIKKVYLRL